ncbi:MAG: HAD family phosphatase [Pirellulales bacterium]|nr:HAD family phosphatase [Pirellulales bacterium]
MSQIKFIYFDMGNVLLYFDHVRAARQMAELSGISQQSVWDLVFAGDLMQKYETGELDTAGFYAEYCRQTGSQPDLALLEHAASDIFTQNTSLLRVISQLQYARYPLGVLSNTCPSHWEFATRHYAAILPQAFQVTVLSYKVGRIKPDPQIFTTAAKMAGFSPAEIFYCDDMPGHVQSARGVGFYAVQYVDTPTLVRDLQSAGVQFNA